MEYVTEWKAGAPLGTTQNAAVARKRRVARARPADTAATAAQPQNPRHELVTGVKPHFLKTRNLDDTTLLRPYKRHSVDIVCSEKQLDAALDAANSLFRGLTEAGHRVALLGNISNARRTEFDVREVPRKHGYIRHAWSPDQATVVFIGETSIGLTVFEMTEFVEMVSVGNSKYIAVRDMAPEQLRRFIDPHYWRSAHEIPSGRLALHAFSTSWRAPWTQRWSEAKLGEFGSLVPKVVKELQAMAAELRRRTDEAGRSSASSERRKPTPSGPSFPYSTACSRSKSSANSPTAWALLVLQIH